MTLNNTAININTNGGSDTGPLATGAASSMTATNTAVTIAGSTGTATGVQADTGGNVMLNVGAVSVSGTGGNLTGLLANGTTSSISGSGLAVNVSSNGGDARGGFLQNGATIGLTSGGVTTSGNAQSYGFLFQAPGGVTNSLNLDGTTVTSAADSLAVQSGSAAVTTLDATVIGNNGILLSTAQNAAVTMMSNHSTLTGAMLTDASSTSNVTLGNGTTWSMTGSSNVTNLTNNDSDIISTPASTAFKTLTVMNYAGAGGTITLNTFLGADHSPSDQLIVNERGDGLDKSQDSER